MKINWKQKLSSRKFWMAIIGVITNLLVIFGVDDITIQQICALISANATLIVYILAEGNIDTKRITQEQEENIEPIPLVVPKGENK